MDRDVFSPQDKVLYQYKRFVVLAQKSIDATQSSNLNGYPIRDFYRSCYRRAIEYYTKASAFSRTKRDSARLCIQLAHTYMLLVPRMYERETQVGLMCKSMGYMG